MKTEQNRTEQTSKQVHLGADKLRLLKDAHEQTNGGPNKENKKKDFGIIEVRASEWAIE